MVWEVIQIPNTNTGGACIAMCTTAICSDVNTIWCHLLFSNPCGNDHPRSQLIHILGKLKTTNQKSFQAKSSCDPLQADAHAAFEGTFGRELRDHWAERWKLCQTKQGTSLCSSTVLSADDAQKELGISAEDSKRTSILMYFDLKDLKQLELCLSSARWWVAVTSCWCHLAHEMAWFGRRCLLFGRRACLWNS